MKKIRYSAVVGTILTYNRTFDSSMFTIASIISAPTFSATVTYHISKLFWHRLALCIFRFQHIIF